MKRKTLTTALLAGLTGAVGIANISNAVNLNPDGLGQTLIYPYYTVRNGTDTLVSVVNTTNEVKAVKVRFLEGENSREVLDFNLYLSPFDVWTGAVIDNGTGGALTSTDASCTVPTIPSPPDSQPFRTFAFTGGRADTGSTTADRTREGHFEMIEMGVVTNSGTATWAAFATHVAGVPANCAAIQDSWRPGGVWTSNPNDGMAPPSGGLFGGASLIQVLAGLDVGYNADAIDGFSDTVLHTGPGEETPSLNQANTTAGGPGATRSIVFNNGNVVTSDWANGVEAVSAVYMHNAIMNEYVLDAATLSGTDWVNNFPTKRFYVDPAFSIGTAPVQPFTSIFPGGPDGDGAACEPISLSFWDREERTTVGDIDFSPLPPQGGNFLCWETTIITFDNSDILGSALSENVNPSSAGFENGWMRIQFNNAGNTTTSLDGDTYNGLPVTGFQVQTFTNGTLTDDEGTAVLSNYAGLFGHRATRDITESGTGT